MSIHQTRQFLSASSRRSSPQETATFTVMTYNILAQCLTRRRLYPYASKKALKLATRQRLLQEQLQAMNPSIACLQEVDNLNNWTRLFRELKYGYLYCQHPLKQHGCCIIYKQELFELSGYKEVDLDEVGKVGEPSDAHPPASGMTKTMAQILALRWKEHQGKGIIISNHHLFWPPLAAYEKLRQACVVLESCVSMGLEYQWPVLMCGDFNSTPESAVYCSLTGHTVTEKGMKELDTIPSNYFPQEDEERDSIMDEESKVKLGLLSPQALLDRMASLPRATSAYGQYVDVDTEASNDWAVSGEPRWTNYTEWKGTLDYIFQVALEGIEPLVLQGLLKLPTEDMLLPGLPNDQWGSDHLCLMAEYAKPLGQVDTKPENGDDAKGKGALGA